MTEELLHLQKDLLSLTDKDNIVCFLVFGSVLTTNNANDFDAILIVKKVDSTLNNLFNLLLSRYKKLDINIYSQEEVLDGLSFCTREFKLEYLSKGWCIYGKNVLQGEYLKVNDYKYRQSMLIRSIERLQMVRQNYFTSAIKDQEKLNYLRKYFFRISKSVLILQSSKRDFLLGELDQDEINRRLFSVGIFDMLPNMDNIQTLNEYFNLFDILAKALMKCKKNLNL